MCLKISNNLLLVLWDAPKRIFFYELAIFWSAPKRRKDTPKTLHPLSTVIFATATVLAFVLLRNSNFSFHCYTQREATPIQKSARKCAATSRDFFHERLQSAFDSSKPASLNRPVVTYFTSNDNLRDYRKGGYSTNTIKSMVSRFVLAIRCYKAG